MFTLNGFVTYGLTLVISATVTGLDVVTAYSQENMFDLALVQARILQEDASHVFTRLAQQCVRLTDGDKLALYVQSGLISFQQTYIFDSGDGEVDWLLTDELSSWPGTIAERAWRFLRKALEQHDKPDSEWPYRKAVFEAIIELNRIDCLPTWLIQFFEVCCSEFNSICVEF